MLSKSLIQFSVDGRGCVPSLLFDLRANHSGSNKENGDLLQKVPCMHCHTQCPHPCSRPPLTHTSARESWTLREKSGSVYCEVTAFSWSWRAEGFVCALQESVSPVLCKFWRLCGGVNGNLFQEDLCHTLVYCTQSPYSDSKTLLTRTSAVDTQTHRGRSGSVSVGSPGVHKVLFETSKHLR